MSVITGTHKYENGRGAEEGDHKGRPYDRFAGAYLHTDGGAYSMVCLALYAPMPMRRAAVPPVIERRSLSVRKSQWLRYWPRVWR